jgi:hypothetical protein
VLPPGSDVVATESTGFTTKLNGLEAVCGVGVPASVTVSVTGEVPALVGTPVICPLAASANPAGKVPVVTAHEYVGVPPLACTLKLYELFTVALGSVAVATANGAGLTLMLTCCVALIAGLPESVTFTVKVEVATVVGVPVIAPVPVLRLNPAGRVPAETLQVSVPAPPLAFSVCEYAAPTVPPGREVLETAGADVIVRLTAAVLVESATDVAVTVTASAAETVLGALYVVAVAVPAVSVPQAAPVQDAPETVHVTPLLKVSLATVAVKLICWP